ncbi:olfactory receptor 14A16-like [Tiliqua scincoides]|uniref:olfactory receptor 14A16-like n=1 Tax=Tiliqua scincoides TaxID=71010 RepID=UPI0034630197
MINHSSVTEFLLMGFSDDRQMQIFHFGIFLSIYFIALTGNFLLIIAVALNHNLHSPMYFFLVNLSFSDVGYISATVPKSMADSWTNNKLISFSGCFAQVFSVIAFGSVELALLTVMAYDRYIAICCPLQYTIIMNWVACIQMAAASWTLGVLNGVIETGMTFRLNFCSTNIIRQFFCDMPQLQKISCTDTQANHILVTVLGSIVGVFCVGGISVSYGYIFSAVLKISSDQGRYRAFSTCIPHLTIFSLFVITTMFSYVRPKELSFPTLDLLSALLYAVLPPVLNPIIYSLRNKDIQESVLKIPKKLKRFIM